MQRFRAAGREVQNQLGQRIEGVLLQIAEIDRSLRVRVEHSFSPDLKLWHRHGIVPARRFLVATQWLVRYVTRQRGARLITESESKRAP